MSESTRSGRSSGGFVPGLFKGLATTARSVTKHNHTTEYPDVKPDLPPRSRGVIALTEENCTSCMLCARECPDWCIYIDSHKEEIPAATPGGRARQRNVLDRFAIDFSLCMYCGICIEVCPFDALHWSPEFEYAEVDIRELLHEKGKLGEWMATVPPPPALDPGSADPAELSALSRPARPAAGAAPAARPTTARPATARPTTARRAAPGSVAPEAVQPAEPAHSPSAAAVAQPPSGYAGDAARQPAPTPPAPTGPPSPPEPDARPSATRVLPVVTPEPERPESQSTVAMPVQSPDSDSTVAMPVQSPGAGAQSAEPTEPGEPTEPVESTEPVEPGERPASSTQRPAEAPERPAPERPTPEGDA